MRLPAPVLLSLALASPVRAQTLADTVGGGLPFNYRAGQSRANSALARLGSAGDP